MAINPLQLPPIISPPRIDFAPLSELGNVYREGAVRRKRNDLLQDATLDGTPESLAALGTKLVQAGDLQGGVTLARLAEAAKERSFEQGYKNDMLTLQAATTAANISGSKVPPGFRQAPGGALAPIPGGPQDPSYIRSTNEAKEKPRQMSINDITKLSDEGQKFADLKGFHESFEDRFAGYRSPVVGNIATTAGRNLPESVVGKDVADGASYWQRYDRYKNVVRNELYGAALTPGETAAFERADINPAMTPEQIRKNLATQKQIVENGLRRKTRAMVESGYNPKAIAEAYGVDPSGLGVQTETRGPRTDANAPQRVTSKAQFDAMPSGTRFTAPDGSIRVKP